MSESSVSPNEKPAETAQAAGTPAAPEAAPAAAGGAASAPAPASGEASPEAAAPAAEAGFGAAASAPESEPVSEPAPAAAPAAAADSAAEHEAVVEANAAAAVDAVLAAQAVAVPETAAEPAPGPVQDFEPVDVSPKERFSYTQNRELSWLQFDKRVLEEALDSTVPLYERLKFVAIFESNLTEFFMVRVGSLLDLELLDPDTRDNKSDMTAAEQLDAIYDEVRPLVAERDEIYRRIRSALTEYGIEELDLEALAKPERKFARDYFKQSLRPILSPQVVDSRHPFPFLRNGTLYVIAPLVEEDGTKVMGIVPVPDEAPDFVRDPASPMHFVRTEQIIAHNMGKLFDIYKTGKPCVICVTRNADISFDEEKFSDDEGDFRLHVSKLLKKRKRLNPVRLQVQGKLDGKLRDMLLEYLGLTEDQLYVSPEPISLQGVYAFEKRLTPELKAMLCHPHFSPRPSQEFDMGRSILDQVEERDRILFYPYDSMEPFLRMLSEAASDPTVISMKITLYRVASDSRVAQALAEAAENGKDVTVLMELRARFDEANNIDWSERLEEAGCNIIYGMENYKCHSKLCLITRRKPDGKLVKISQVGTGNYNEKTARLYTDLCLCTADEKIGQDAVSFFQNMLIGNLNGSYDRLLVAPVSMKRTIIKGIERETAKGPEGRIMMKCNSVTERDVIDKLVVASKAGVRIDMNVRGICCLVPGIEGKTENIHVRSIVGQFLEHSRIYCFGTGDDMLMYISSADLMTRNLVHRVEVACPILDPRVRDSISVFLEKIFADNTKARELQSDGSYVFVERAEGEQSFTMHDWCVKNPLQQPPATLAKPVERAQAKQAPKPAGKSADKSASARPAAVKAEGASAEAQPQKKKKKGFFARLFGGGKKE